MTSNATYEAITSDVLNALSKLVDSDLEVSEVSDMYNLLSEKLSTLVGGINKDLINFLAILASCYLKCGNTINEHDNDENDNYAERDNEDRNMAIQSLSTIIQPICETLKIDTELATIAVGLRQGNFFIIDDSFDFLRPLLASSRVSRIAMGLAVVGGMTFASFLSLFVIPAIYTYLAASDKTLLAKKEMINGKN